MSSLEKNLSLYLPMGAWFVTSLVTWVHNEFEEPKCFIHTPLLVYIGWISILLLSVNSRKFLPLKFNAWKIICHFWTRESHFSFLLDSHDDLLRNVRSILRCFVSLSTNKCGDHLMLSEQSQNSITLLRFLLKNFFRSLDIAIECNWYRWINILKIYLAVRIASVIMIIWSISNKWTVWLILHLIAKSSVSVELTLVV